MRFLMLILNFTLFSHQKMDRDRRVTKKAQVKKQVPPQLNVVSLPIVERVVTKQQNVGHAASAIAREAVALES